MCVSLSVSVSISVCVCVCVCVLFGGQRAGLQRQAVEAAGSAGDPSSSEGLVELLHAALRPHLRQTGHAVELQQPLLRSVLGPLGDLLQRGVSLHSRGRELGAAAQRARGPSLALPHQTLIDHGLQTHAAQLVLALVLLV